MAQPQPQLPHQIPPRAFSPPQMALSPAGGAPSQPPNSQSSAAFALPPNKRPRTDSPANSQPATPYAPSPYSAPSPSSVLSPVMPPSPAMPSSPAVVASPSMALSPAPLTSLPTSSLPSAAVMPPSTYQSPMYTPNGTPTASVASNLNLPMSPAPAHVPMPHAYTNATLAVSQSQMPLTPGVMAPPPVMGPPPTRPAPAERQTKEYEYDVADSLAGTGIDLRAEEQYLADYYAGSFTADSRTGLPANLPGNKTSFYGAGIANQPAQPTNAKTQEQMIAEVAEAAWSESAARLAAARSDEVNNPFLLIPLLHRRIDKIAREHKLEVNLETKNASQSIGRLRQPQDFYTQPTVSVSTKVGPDGASITTTGSWIPHDAYLVDQLALLSIATKHRLHDRIEDSHKLALDRQASSHGDVPTDWINAAAQLVGPGDTGATSPSAQSRKRSFSTAAISNVKATTVASVMRDIGKGIRSLEEERLRKRQKRQVPDMPVAPSRAASNAPGTPGSVAPEPEKAPSKSQKKSGGASRLAETSSTASANQTLATLMGGFGGKKKGKSYSWMTAGSGASTPRASAGSAGAASVSSAAKAPEKTNLTQEGRYRLGMWREDSEKAKGIQLRDWVAALELEGIEVRAIQQAYASLDSSAR